MNGEEALSKKTRELAESLRKQTLDLAFSEILSSADDILKEAEYTINSFLKIDPNAIYKTLDRHGITVYEGGVEPHTCGVVSQGVLKTNFIIYETKLVKARFLSDNIVEVNGEKSIRPIHTQHIIHSAIWTKSLICCGHAERNGVQMTATGITNITLISRTTNQRTSRICTENNETHQTTCDSGREFNTRSTLEGTLTLGNGSTHKCIYESPHPDTIFKVKGRQVTLTHEELDNELKTLSEPKIFTDLISFKSQKESLENLKQMIKIIAPQTENQPYSLIDHTYLLYYAGTGVTILLIIRVLELAWYLIMKQVYQIQNGITTTQNRTSS